MPEDTSQSTPVPGAATCGSTLYPSPLHLSPSPPGSLHCPSPHLHPHVHPLPHSHSRPVPPPPPKRRGPDLTLPFSLQLFLPPNLSSPRPELTAGPGLPHRLPIPGPQAHAVESVPSIRAAIPSQLSSTSSPSPPSPALIEIKPQNHGLHSRAGWGASSSPLLLAPQPLQPACRARLILVFLPHGQ